MSFKNIPSNIKSANVKVVSPDEEAIRLFRLHQYGKAIAYILARISVRERLDFYMFALTKVPLRSYKQGIELLKVAVDTVFSTGNDVIADEYRKNFNTNSQFDRVANGIITEALYPTGTSDQWRMTLIDFIYGIQDPRDREGHTKALADLLEFKYNNTTFRLMYATN